MTEKLYRLHWRAKRTGVEGNGTKGFLKERAKRELYLARKGDSISKFFEYWIEPVPEPLKEMNK